MKTVQALAVASICASFVKVDGFAAGGYLGGLSSVGSYGDPDDEVKSSSFSVESPTSTPEFSYLAADPQAIFTPEPAVDDLDEDEQGDETLGSLESDAFSYFPEPEVTPEPAVDPTIFDLTADAGEEEAVSAFYFNPPTDEKGYAEFSSSKRSASDDLNYTKVVLDPTYYSEQFTAPVSAIEGYEGEIEMPSDSWARFKPVIDPPNTQRSEFVFTFEELEAKDPTEPPRSQASPAYSGQIYKSPDYEPVLQEETPSTEAYTDDIPTLSYLREEVPIADLPYAPPPATPSSFETQETPTAPYTWSLSESQEDSLPTFSYLQEPEITAEETNDTANSYESISAEWAQDDDNTATAFSDEVPQEQPILPFSYLNVIGEEQVEEPPTPVQEEEENAPATTFSFEEPTNIASPALSSFETFSSSIEDKGKKDVAEEEIPTLSLTQEAEKTTDSSFTFSYMQDILSEAEEVQEEQAAPAPSYMGGFSFESEEAVKDAVEDVFEDVMENVVEDVADVAGVVDEPSPVFEEQAEKPSIFTYFSYMDEDAPSETQENIEEVLIENAPKDESMLFKNEYEETPETDGFPDFSSFSQGEISTDAELEAAAESFSNDLQEESPFTFSYLSSLDQHVEEEVSQSSYTAEESSLVEEQEEKSEGIVFEEVEPPLYSNIEEEEIQSQSSQDKFGGSGEIVETSSLEELYLSTEKLEEIQEVDEDLEEEIVLSEPSMLQEPLKEIQEVDEDLEEEIILSEPSMLQEPVAFVVPESIGADKETNDENAEESIISSNPVAFVVPGMIEDKKEASSKEEDIVISEPSMKKEPVAFIIPQMLKNETAKDEDLVSESSILQQPAAFIVPQKLESETKSAVEESVEVANFPVENVEEENVDQENIPLETPAVQEPAAIVVSNLENEGKIGSDEEEVSLPVADPETKGEKNVATASVTGAPTPSILDMDSIDAFKATVTDDLITFDLAIPMKNTTTTQSDEIKDSSESPKDSEGSSLEKKGGDNKRNQYKSKTQRIMEKTSGEEQTGGAGGSSTWEAFQKAEERWEALKQSKPFTYDMNWLRNVQNGVPRPHQFVTTDGSDGTEAGWTKLREQAVTGEMDYDVIVCGGTLGIFFATALQLKGFKVAVVEAGKLRGREQEWNISMKELQELEELGVITQEDIDTVITTEFPGCRAGFKNEEVTPVKGTYFENGIGYECVTADILNLGVAPRILLERVAERFKANGGTVYEERPLKAVMISEKVGAAVDLVTPDGSDSPITARLVLDAMGNGSPISRQQRYGMKPDGICCVVGSCASGFDSKSNLMGDIIYTNSMIQDKGINGKLQYFWETFPVGIGRDGKEPGTSDTKTTYMFTYLDADEQRPSLSTLMEDYWKLLPKYQTSINDAEKDLDVKRVLFAFFPTFKDSPLQTQFSRVLAVGDASGIQSPLSFGGFGALTRHLPRITGAISDAMENDCLHKDDLALINAYTPNLSASWMFQKAMSVQMGQNVNPKFINRLLATNFKIMEDMGQETINPFLQDVVRFDGLVGSLARSFVADPLFMPEIVNHVGLKELGDWVGHVGMMGLYSVLDSTVSPVIKRAIKKITNPRERFQWLRKLEAWKFGSGNDYITPKNRKKKRIQREPEEKGGSEATKDTKMTETGTEETAATDEVEPSTQA